MRTVPAGSRVFLDTNAIIYWVEDVAPYAEMLRPVIEAADRGGIVVVVGALSLMETLVEPLRKGDMKRAARFRQMITAAPGVEYWAITDDVLERAAELRAKTTMRTPDAILAATSLLAGCDVFITNDSRLRVVPGLQTLILSDAGDPISVA